jgi:hypothetical protein
VRKEDDHVSRSGGRNEAFSPAGGHCDGESAPRDAPRREAIKSLVARRAEVCILVKICILRRTMCTQGVSGGGPVRTPEVVQISEVSLDKRDMMKNVPVKKNSERIAANKVKKLRAVAVILCA